MNTAKRHRIEFDLIEELEILGYKVWKFAPWHWRVSAPDSDIEVDVWPTTKKLMPRIGHWKSRHYKNLLKEIPAIIYKR